MSLSVNFTFDIYNSDGNKVVVVDTTPPYSSNETGGYGSPNPTRANISLTRLLIGNYPSMIAEAKKVGGDTLTQYRKYLKTAGSAQVYDNKTISSGDIYIPFLSNLTVISGDEFTDLGVYVPYLSYATFNPSTMDTLILSIPELGLPSTDETVQDLVWNVQYEVYGLATGIPFTSTEGLQYIVVSGGTAVQSGNTYRVGEVFVGDATSVTLNGGATVASLASTTEKTFVTDYNLRLQLYNLQAERLANPCACEQDSQIKIAKLYNLLEFIQYQAYTNLVSYEQCTSLLGIASQQIQEIKNLPC